MPAKGRARQKQAAEYSDNESEDSSESASTAVTVDALSPNPPEAVTMLPEHIENLSEKRAAVRRGALDGVRIALTSSVCLDELHSRVHSLTSALTNLMRKGDADEAMLAARCMGLCWITIGTHGFEMFEEHKVSMRTVISSRRNGGVAAAAMELIALPTLLSCQDTPEVLQTMDECWDRTQARSITSVDLVSALSAWGLCVTMLPVRCVTRQVGPWLERLGPLLTHGDLDVRTAAGECIALVLEAHYAYAEDADPDDVSPLPNLDELRARVKELVAHCAKSTAKADRATQRSIFRDVEDTLDGNHDISEKLKLHGEALELTGWAERKQMAVVRKYLQEGLQRHLASNIMLRDMFGLGAPLCAADLSRKKLGEDRKLAMERSAAESKLRTQRRCKQRNVRDQRNHSFLTEE